MNLSRFDQLAADSGRGAQPEEEIAEDIAEGETGQAGAGKKRKRAKAKAKAKARAKLQAQAKAKRKEKKQAAKVKATASAASKEQEVPDGTTGKRRRRRSKKEDEAVEATEAASGAHDNRAEPQGSKPMKRRRSTKMQDDGEIPAPEEPKDDPPEVQVKAKAKVKATFARRYMPEKEPGRSWLMALRDAFQKRIQDHVKAASYREDRAVCPLTFLRLGFKTRLLQEEFLRWCNDKANSSQEEIAVEDFAGFALFATKGFLKSLPADKRSLFALNSDLQFPPLMLLSNGPHAVSF